MPKSLMDLPVELHLEIAGYVTEPFLEPFKATNRHFHGILCDVKTLSCDMSPFELAQLIEDKPYFSGVRYFSGLRFQCYDCGEHLASRNLGMKIHREYMKEI